MRRHRRINVAIRVVLLLLGLVVIAVPFAWVLLTAFKRQVDASAVPPMIFSPTTTKNFVEIFSGPFGESLVNSVIITVMTTVSTLAFGVPAGYAFARGRFRGRRFLGGWLLLSRMFPPVLFIIPLFLFFHQLNLIDSFLGLTLAYLTGLLPFTIWMTASYFQDVPMELEDAARVDGATRLQAFARVALPLSLPGVLTVGFLIGIAAWSEYFTPLLLSGVDTTPATVALVNYVGGVASVNWGAMAAASLTLIVPVFLVTLLAQRGMLRGISAGAVKG